MEWVGHVVTSVVTTGVISALFAGWLKMSNARHRQHRETRGDEITVLQDSIDELRKDRNEMIQEMKTQQKDWQTRDRRRDQEIGALKDEHTVCLIEQGRLRERNAALEIKVGLIERQLTLITGEPRGCHGENPGG